MELLSDFMRNLKVDEVQCNLSPASLVNLIFPSEEFSPVPRVLGKMFRISFTPVRTCSVCMMKLAYVK